MKLPFVLLLSFVAGSVSVAMGAPPRREPEPPAPAPGRRDPPTPDYPRAPLEAGEPLDGRDARESRERRRRPEPSPRGPSLPLDVAETPLLLDLTGEAGFSMCHARGWKRVRDRLEGLDNTSQYMSLEVWGDAEDYGPFQTVLFQMRSPRGAYVTLYWLGPDGHITVPLENVRIPGERNVTIDTGGIIVAPYGRERWVAIATLEPFPIGCSGEAAMLANLERRLRTTHGVGRWEVVSRPASVPAPP